jgi:hypothetical protein
MIHSRLRTKSETGSTGKAFTDWTGHVTSFMLCVLRVTVHKNSDLCSAEGATNTSSIIDRCNETACNGFIMGGN